MNWTTFLQLVCLLSLSLSDTLGGPQRGLRFTGWKEVLSKIPVRLLPLRELDSPAGAQRGRSWVCCAARPPLPLRPGRWRGPGTGSVGDDTHVSSAVSSVLAGDEGPERRDTFDFPRQRGSLHSVHWAARAPRVGTRMLASEWVHREVSAAGVGVVGGEGLGVCSVHRPPTWKTHPPALFSVPSAGASPWTWLLGPSGLEDSRRRGPSSPRGFP